MKTLFFRRTTLGIVLATLWLASDCSVQFSNAQAQPAPPASTTTDASTVPPPNVTPPPSILPNSPLAQVIKLVQAGVDQNVITSYIANSTSTFNLDSDKIIYLSDLGVPNELVNAMMQRDQVLQQQIAASTPPPAPPETPPTEPPPVETPEPPPPPEPTEVTVNYFYTSLAPYGTWVDVPDYGRCWRPTIVVYNSGWQPYCDRGHWVYTDCGWYWTSDYSWGVTFHYGRWFHHPHLGWCWWPDTVWAPSWVTWRYSDDYCGWAPLPPFAVYRPGAGFFYRGSSVSVGFDFGLAINCFTFVPTRHFCDPHPRHFRIAPNEGPRIFNQTTVINNFNFDSHNRTVVNNGIGVQHITAVTRTPIQPVPVHELRVSREQPWRGGSVGGQNHGPGVTTGNPPHPGPVFDNRNNSTPHNGMPTQNRVSQPGNNQTQPPNRNGPPTTQTPTGPPAQTHLPSTPNNQILQPNRNGAVIPQGQTWNYDNKHVTSPRGQQFEQQTPHRPLPANSEFTTPGEQQQSAPPAANYSTGQTGNRSANQPATGSRSNASAPHQSQSSQSSSSSNQSNNQNQNQGGRGH